MITARRSRDRDKSFDISPCFAALADNGAFVRESVALRDDHRMRRASLKIADEPRSHQQRCFGRYLTMSGL
jgi:hypothetical protein